MYFVVAYAYSGLSPVRARPWRANRKAPSDHSESAFSRFLILFLAYLYNTGLLVEHEVDQLLDISRVIRYQLKLRDLLLDGEDIRQRQELAELALQVQSVAFPCDQFDLSLAGIDYFKKLLRILNIL